MLFSTQVIEMLIVILFKALHNCILQYMLSIQTELNTLLHTTLPLLYELNTVKRQSETVGAIFIIQNYTYYNAQTLQ